MRTPGLLSLMGKAVDLVDAEQEVEAFFNNYGMNARPALVRHSKGKVYELYCLARTIEFLKTFPGVSVRFVGTSVDFQASPGKVDRSRSYFVISGNGPDLELHTDVEVQTLSSFLMGGAAGPSAHHEIDLVLVERAQDRQRPAHHQVVLGVECKAYANFSKEIVKQVLGLRRELSLYRPAPSKLLEFLVGQPSAINADPGSEYWLAFVDPKGMRYGSGPAAFSIEFKHWCPPLPVLRLGSGQAT